MKMSPAALDDLSTGSEVVSPAGTVWRKTGPREWERTQWTGENRPRSTRWVSKNVVVVDVRHGEMRTFLWLAEMMSNL